ncbi:uncharacterized protein LOC129770972 isoform X2 [Toxorhynchites rutilus septentrionalis]|uniref:uncharacterized protein LOC129770972 isoform X2 n=1 Tax=Toxorhynchites rutilus septentrionalis TaxID=329112 RepID=UPI00247A7309|nr:uncharacterized protein LOC129770972 isoform X2 [Toxorhynchites rutilus septentrionalis]
MKDIFNGVEQGKLWKYVRLLILLISILCQAEGLPKVFRSNDICGVYNGHRVYLELGDRGQLQATNVTISKDTNQTTPSSCSLELVTCPSCNFKISLSYSNFPTKCPNHNALPCRCDYLEFSEPPFDVEQSGRRNCGRDVVYQTQTRSVLIRFLYWNNHTHAFTLEYVAERNRETLQANPGGIHNLTRAHIKSITTPYFPSYYPRDFGKEYVLNCNVDECRINVIFSDFHLAKTSTMEFYDWNGQRLVATSGVSFRPPVVQSSGPSMIIRFYANGGSALGYRALVSFLTIESASNPVMQPDTNCGGMVENIGGAITMMKMVPGEADTKIYDCIWLVKPPNTYAHLKTHLMLKIDTFDKMGPNSMLTLVQGTISDNAILDVVRPSSGTNGKSYVVPLTSGFYVHLRATFGYMSRMALVYAAFSYLDCYMGTEFLCENRKCIPIQLHCDGFDHCGDGSDEPESCEAQWESEPIDRRWYSHTPNYYFPKIDRYPDLRTATFIFIATSLGLIMLVSAFIVLLSRSGNRARQQRELQSQLQTISELLAENNDTRGAEEVDDPPMYEAPPDYDEIIKVGMDEDMKRKRKRHSSSASGRRSRARRSRRPSEISNSQHPILEVRLPSEEASDGPSTSVTPPPTNRDENQQIYYEECDDAHGTNWIHSEPDFFISTRIVEDPTTSSANQSQDNGYQVPGRASSSGNTNSSSNYDDSQFAGNSGHQNASNRASSSDVLSEVIDVTLGSNEMPQQAIERLPPPPLHINHSNINGSKAAHRLRHMWNENARFQRPWLAFDNDDRPTAVAPPCSTSATISNIQNICATGTYDPVNSRQIEEKDDHLLASGYTSNEELRSCNAFCDCYDSGTSCMPTTSTSITKPCLDSSTGFNDYIVRDYTCCAERNRIPMNMCSSCGGKISIQDSPSPGSSSDPKIMSVNGEGQPPIPGSAVRLCNCFPKFPSQKNVVRSGLRSSRPGSLDQIEFDGQRQTVAHLTNSFEAYLNPPIGIPNPSMRI